MKKTGDACSNELSYVQRAVRAVQRGSDKNFFGQGVH
jgi:hypothetical protein